MQLSAQESFNASGGNASGIGGQVSYSYGQVFYHHLNGDNAKIQEGVQNSYQIINNIPANSSLIKLEIHPNPSSDLLHLTLSDFKQNLSYSIFSAQGQLLQSKQINSTSTLISIGKYAKQLLIISIDQQDQNIGSFTIIKN